MCIVRLTILQVAPLQEWLPTFLLIVDILAEAAVCLAHYHHGLHGNDDSEEPPIAATELIDTLVDAVRRLPSEVAVTQLSVLCRVLKVLPEPVSCTAYLNHFQEAKGPELLVSVIAALEGKDVAAVKACLDTLGGVIARTAVVARANEGGEGGVAGYWLRAPRSGRFEYQAMVIDVVLQVLERTPLVEVAEHAVALLADLFPSRPLYGTSNARAIFATLRQRFSELGPTFQSLAIQFTQRVLSIEPSQVNFRYLSLDV